ncbi:MAG: respiratory nitrate reductase subunit gamma [Pirellulaceae bacterium]
MEAVLKQLDMPLLVVLPYVAVFTMILVTIQRYRTSAFTYSSLSSQFLENKKHFWSVVPMHYGIIIVLLGHVVAFLLPDVINAWNRQPLRLYALEVFALATGVITLVGLLCVVARRITTAKVRIVTTASDWILMGLLLIQAGTGIGVAVFHPWGSSWFATSVTPYLWSLVTLQPDVTRVAGMPLLAKGHFVNAFLVIGFFPFTRLVHILVVPNPYLWRKPQVVRWYRGN